MNRPAGVADPRSALQRGSLLNLGGAAATAASTLLLVLLTARLVSAEDAGRVFAATSAFLLVAAALRGGAPTAVVLFIARHAHAPDGHARTVARMALRPALLATAATCVALVVAARPVAGAAGLGAGPEAWTAVLVLAACLPAAVALDIVLAVSRGRHDMRPTVVVDRLGRPVLQLVLTAAAATAPSVVTLTAAWALPYLVAVLVAAWLTPALRTPPAVEAAAGERREFRRFVVVRGGTVLMQVAFSRLDIVLVALLAGPAQAAVYTVATRFVSICQLVQQAVGSAGEPALARAMGDRDPGAALGVYRTTTTWVVMLLWPALVVVAVLSPWWLPLFGPEYAGSTDVVLPLALAMLVATGVGTAETVLNMAGRTTVLLGTNAVALAAMVGLDLWLIPSHGAAGAALGWAAAIVVKNVLAAAQAAVTVGGTPFSRPWRVVVASVSLVALPAGLLVSCDAGGSGARAEPTARGVLVGAAAPQVLPAGGSQATAFDRLDAVIGQHTTIAHVFRPWGSSVVPPGLDELAASRVVLVSWNAADIIGIARGDHDAELRTEAEALAATGEPVLLRFRWEMDRPNLRSSVGSPDTFVAAWRRARAIFAAAGADRAAWVWCPTAAGFTGDAAAFYPGDDEVDWLCADAYPGRSMEGLGDLLTPFLTWADGHDKPIMIGEFGVPRTADDQARAAWIDAASAWLAGRDDIRAVVYFALDVVPDAPVLQFGLDPGSAAAAAFGRLVHDLGGGTP